MISVLDNGFVRLVDSMPKADMDSAIVEAARVSYQNGTKTVRKDEALIRYLFRNDHSSPFEMAVLKFHVKAPIFVARQWMRHRTASINEISGRYSVLPDVFHIPDELCCQDLILKQSSGSDAIGDSQNLLAEMDKHARVSFGLYKTLLDAGVARESAREVLPVSTYTEFYWQINLRNLFHFLKLRMDHHAQKEIQAFARAIFEIVKPLAPHSCKAFQDYSLERVQLSKLEIKKLLDPTVTFPSKSEEAEFQEKMRII
jgi:thymidylate synthase (FAD)